MKGKSLQWYRELPHNSITYWDGLGVALCKHFEDKSNYLSLLENLTTIKRAPHEYMNVFNYRFPKTLDTIPTLVKPTSSNYFLHYLRALNNDISTTIQTMRGDTSLDAYEIKIRVEILLIQGSKLAPRPPMPFFPNMPNQQPTIAPILTSSTSKPISLVPQASTSSSDLGELKALMQDIGKKLQIQDKKLEDSFSLIQKVRKKVVTLER